MGISTHRSTHILRDESCPVYRYTSLKRVHWKILISDYFLIMSTTSFYSRYKQLLPVAIWLIFSMITLWSAMIGETIGNTTTKVDLMPGHYAAFVALAIVFLVFFFAREYYRYALLLTLFCGVFNILVFTGANSYFGISLGAVHIRFQPVSLLVAILFFGINYKRVGAFFEKFNPDVIQQSHFSNEDKLKYKEKYQLYSNEELSTVRINLIYRAEARRAAEELLSERLEGKVKN
jgi:hypothetical protein